ncbi:MAG TPA: hypothetical protein VKT32_11585 [Chthonomonadaceae bacterium]|nr:hypothetical protein [Chthonomonadaceae bacterium]
MQIEFNEAERGLLIELLDQELRDVRSENYHAESHDAKQLFKQRETLVRDLLVKLQGFVPEHPPGS